jgi:hypothetical protein
MHRPRRFRPFEVANQVPPQDSTATNNGSGNSRLSPIRLCFISPFISRIAELPNRDDRCSEQAGRSANRVATGDADCWRESARGHHRRHGEDQR